MFPKLWAFFPTLKGSTNPKFPYRPTPSKKKTYHKTNQNKTTNIYIVYAFTCFRGIFLVLKYHTSMNVRCWKGQPLPYLHPHYTIWVTEWPFLSFKSAQNQNLQTPFPNQPHQFITVFWGKNLNTNEENVHQMASNAVSLSFFLILKGTCP